MINWKLEIKKVKAVLFILSLTLTACFAQTTAPKLTDWHGTSKNFWQVGIQGGKIKYNTTPKAYYLVIPKTGGGFDSLYFALSEWSAGPNALLLKASVSQYNQVSDSLETAFAQILLEAQTRNSADSTLTASLSLKVSANDVFSLMEILPDSIKIQSDNIILDGEVVATSLFGQEISGATILSTYSNKSLTIENATTTWAEGNTSGLIEFSQSGGFLISRTGGGNTTSSISMMDDIAITNNSGVLTLNGSQVVTGTPWESEGYLTTETDPTIYAWAKASTKPSYTYSEVGASASSHTHTGSTISDLTVSDFASQNISQWTNNSNYVTTSTQGWRTDTVTGIGSGLDISAGTLQIDFTPFSGAYADLTGKPTIPSISWGAIGSYYLADIDYYIETIGLTINGVTHTIVTGVAR